MPARCAGRAIVISAWRTGGAGDAPARGGGAGARAIWRKQQQHRRTGHGRCAGKTLGLLEIWRACLAHDGEQAACARAFFHRPKHVLRLVRIDEQQARGVEAEGGQPVAVKRAEFAPGEAVAAPQDRAPRLRGCRQEPQKAETEAERGGHVGVGVRGDLVQRAARQPAIGQGGVHLGQTETPRRGRRLIVAFRRGFKRAHLPAKLIKQPGAVAPGRGVARVLRLVRGG